MKLFFATFAMSSPLKNHFVGIIAQDSIVATAAMKKIFDLKWGHIYPVDHDLPDCGLRGQIERYGIRSLFFMKADALGYDILNPEVRLIETEEWDSQLLQLC